MNGERLRLSPVVAGLMFGNAIVWIVLATVLTLPAVPEALQFDPAAGLRRPWTLMTYLFVHPRLWVLSANLLLLLAFGPPVERRMGSAAFLLHYLAGGIGAALFGVALTSFTPVGPLRGAGGAILGTALAFWFAWPDARLVIHPTPFRPRVRTLVLLLAAGCVAAAILLGEARYLAYLGGPLTAYLVFRVTSFRARARRVPPAQKPARAVMRPVSVRQGGLALAERPEAAAAAARPQRAPADELDRVLDKISASGMQSLTADELEFLSRFSERKRKDRG